MGSTQADVKVTYDVGNDFFRLWLDERMSYSCAVFEDEVNHSDPLEIAQENKLRFLSKMAHITSETSSVLDIGCGWGANLEFQVIANHVPNVHGFTLSPEQYKFCVDRKLPNANVQCQDYKLYEAPLKFDAVVTIGMMEHIVSPEAARAGKAVDIYRDCFRRIHSWSRPGSYFGLQAITRCAVPRSKQDLDDLRHGTYVIFPGAVTPRLEDLIIAVHPYYEVMELYSRRLHYKRTCEHWLERLRRNEALIVERWGNQLYSDYTRYLSTCIRAFENNWQSLHQFSLKRLD